ncbi:MAG: hypothetical protein ACI89Z_000647 [Porticoccus sp.]|jgi:hypothetical protein
MLDTSNRHQIEADFLSQYAGGFNNPVMIEIDRKHRMDKMVSLIKECFSKTACSNVVASAENMIKVDSRSSMLSMFKQSKFKEFVTRISGDEKAFLVNALSQVIHGKQQAGFETVVSLLATEKLAKWNIVSIIPAYYSRTTAVFVKPTTAKDIIQNFNIDDPIYKPLTSWDFYKKYLKLVNEGKKEVDPDLSSSSAAFSEFLIMILKF